jgi:sugar/nucleoside kinase (ribokinase family)
LLVAHELEGRPIEEAVLRGQLAARWACAQRASSADLVTREQLEALVAEASGALQTV